MKHWSSCWVAPIFSLLANEPPTHGRDYISRHGLQILFIWSNCITWCIAPLTCQWQRIRERSNMHWFQRETHDVPIKLSAEARGRQPALPFSWQRSTMEGVHINIKHWTDIWRINTSVANTACGTEDAGWFLTIPICSIRIFFNLLSFPFLRLGANR